MATVSTRMRAGTRLVAGVVVASLLLLACGWVLVRAFAAADGTAAAAAPPAPARATSTAPDPDPVAVGVSGPQEDGLAFEPFPPAPAGAAESAPRARTAAPLLEVPAATSTTPGGLPTGFPRTPEGALGQWAAVVAAGFAGYDPSVMGAVFADAAVPGQLARADLREQVATATANRTGSGFPASGAITGVRYDVEAQMGQVRGTSADGGFVLACVVWRVGWSRATPVAFEVSPLTGCARMWWVPDVGWRVEDAETPDPPLVFPLTRAAFGLGWRELGFEGE